MSWDKGGRKVVELGHGGKKNHRVWTSDGDMRNETDKDDSREAISELMQRKKMTGRGCLLLFFLVFFLAGSAVLCFFTILPVARSMLARGWPTARCVVVSSEVERHRSDDGTTYRVKIVYDYEGDATDTTTWTARMRGNPIRLLP